VAAGRLVLCRAGEPLPEARVEGIVRAVRLALGMSLVTLASDWAGVLATWPAGGPDALTIAAIAGLVVTSAAVVAGVAGLARVQLPETRSLEPDGLADATVLVRLVGIRLSWLQRPAVWVARSGETRLAPLIRRRPVTSAAVLSIGFGAVLAVTTALAEGVAPVTALIFAVAGCAMFAFVVLGGSWLRLVSATPSSALHRRLVMAAVAGAAALPTSLAFREAAWDVLGRRGGRGIEDLAVLVTASGIITFAAVLAALTVARRPS
jgi:hypothetical protein